MSVWTEHVARWKDCTACPLHKQRGRICLARGTVPANVVFVGEAPGTSEDAIGQPFVGPAGRLLDQIIERAVSPTVTYTLTNLVCCFPREAKNRGDNEPERGEILACRTRLIEFVNLVQPRLIVCVGKLSTRWVDHGDTIPCVDVDHPASLLRMPLAQKQMAAQRAIVILQNAIEDVMDRERTTFQQWGAKRAGSTTTRDYLRAVYTSPTDADDCPF